MVAAVSTGFIPSPAVADWLITPFVGTTFGADTNLVVLGTTQATQKKFTFGGSLALLSDEVLGVEFDFGYSPQFKVEQSLTRIPSRLTTTTVTGNVIAAIPLAVTQESLRPYLVGGLGLMHASAVDFAAVFPVDHNFLAMTLGGGAIGLITNRTGLRFEIRQFKSLRTEPNPVTRREAAQLSFWRATAGVVIRY